MVCVLFFVHVCNFIEKLLIDLMYSFGSVALVKASFIVRESLIRG